MCANFLYQVERNVMTDFRVDIINEKLMHREIFYYQHNVDCFLKPHVIPQ